MLAVEHVLRPANLPQPWRHALTRFCAIREYCSGILGNADMNNVESKGLKDARKATRF